MSTYTRTRSRTTTLEAPVQRTMIFDEYSWTSVENGNYVQTISTSQQSKGSSMKLKLEDISDVETPNFYAKIRNGAIINNPLDYTSQTLVDQAVYFDSFQAYHPVLPTGVILLKGRHTRGSSSTSSLVGYTNNLRYLTISLGKTIDVNALRDIAVSQAYANISAAEATALVMIGEGKETISFITGSLRRALRIFKAVQKLNFRYLRKQISLKELEKRYMEYRYALRPLISDVSAVSAALASEIKKGSRLTFRGFAERTVSNNPIVSTVDNGYYKYDIVSTAEQTVRVRAGVLTFLQNVNALSIWGLDRPIEAVWELIPFSFIADWFFNIGDVIGSFTPNFGLEELAAWAVIETKTRYIQKACNFRKSSNSQWTAVNTVNCNDGYILREIFRKQRIVNPTRSFVPHLNVNLDGLKLLDLSIIARSYGRKFRGLRI